MFRSYKLLMLILSAVICLSKAELAFAQYYQGVTVGGHITEEQVAALGDEWNVNLVIYPIYIPNAEILDAAGYATALDAALDRLDVLLPIFEAKGIKVLIKLYSPPGGFASVRGTAQHAVFKYQWAADQIVNSWYTIALRYNTNTTVLGYHVLNEPAVGKKQIVKWPVLARRIVDTIRSLDSTHWIGVSAEYGNPALLSKLKPLVGIPNIVFIIHTYYHQYDHQGFPGRRPLKFSKKVFSKFKSTVTAAVKFQRRYGARVMVGEFSTASYVPDASLYLNAVIQYFRSVGFDWAYHSLYEAPVWDPTGKPQADVLKAYFNLNP
jgi:endoglucanase